MRFTALLSFALVVLAPSVGWAQSGAIALTFNTSARYEAMGGSGVGSPWGQSANHWANPANLAFYRGMHLETFQSDLAAGLADDITLHDQNMIIGFDGLGLVFGQGPAHGLYLDMGVQQGTDENGQPTGTFHSYQRGSSYGFGADAVKILDTVRRKMGRESNLSRWGSLSAGYVKKSYRDMLAPSMGLAAPTEAETHDWGWQVAVTPLDTRETASHMGFLVGAAYGKSTLAGGDEFIRQPDADQADPLPRRHLSGWSLHAEAVMTRDHWEDVMPGLLAQSYGTFNPVLSFTYNSQTIEPGFIWDADSGEYVYEHDTSGERDEEGQGWELGVMNIFYIRQGTLEIPYGDIDDDTSGWGINLELTPQFGVRYDKATVPQATGLPDVERETWAFWFDPTGR